MIAQTLTVEHRQRTPAQDAFWHSDAKFLAFTGGVGSGKTRAGCVKTLIESQQAGTLGVVAAPTYPMLRDATLRTWLHLARRAGVLAAFKHSTMSATLVNGSEVWFRSADEPDRLRGPNIGWFWLDEAAMMEIDVWHIMLGRLREAPGKAWVTTTPRGGNWIYKIWAKEPQPGYELIRSSTRENRFLPADFVHSLEQSYTRRFARQEIEGEFLLDTPGALWTWAMLDNFRVNAAPELVRIVVGVDPKASVEADSETGIVVAGIDAAGHAYVIGDASVDDTPERWGRKAVQTYHAHNADRIVAETNQGGDMVTTVLRMVDPYVPVRGVHASRGKATRAEPVAALYEQGRVHHVGSFAALEDQMCSWVPGDKSPDRMDALVWALTELMVKKQPREAFSYQG